MKPLTKETIDNYVIHGWLPGGFVQAVLENDLMGAMARADSVNRADIYEICDYVYNEIPHSCHGSPAAFRAWLNRTQEEIEATGQTWLTLQRGIENGKP